MSKYERAKNLGDEDIQSIVSILDGWSGKLTWDLLINTVSKRLHQQYTRQALNNHTRIAEAFRLRKKSLQGESGARPKRKTGDSSQEFGAALQRIKVLEAENERLEAENNNLLAQFARWAHNGSTRNIDVNFLNQPLPTVSKDSTTVTMEEISKRSRR